MDLMGQRISGVALHRGAETTCTLATMAAKTTPSAADSLSSLASRDEVGAMREFSFLGKRLFLVVYPKELCRSWHLWWRARFYISVLFHDGVSITFRSFP